MIINIIIFVTCAIAMLVSNKVVKDKKLKHIIEIGILIFLCILAGTRYYLGGTDYYVYKIIYNSVPLLNKFDFSTVQDLNGTYSAEIGYLFINSLFKTLNFSFFGFTLIHSIFFYSCMYIGLKKYISNFNMLIVIFLYKMFYYNTFISMRQSIAIAIFFMAMKYIQEKKFFKYMILTIIAICFHEAALIMIPIYFISNWNITKKQIIILNCIFIPTIVISFLGIPILEKFQFITNIFSNQDKATALFGATGTSSISIFHSLEYFLIMVLVIFNYEKIIKIDKNAEFIIKIFLIMLPLFTMFRGYEILTRIKDFFTLSYAIILWYMCKIENGKYKTIVQIGVIAICAYGFFRFVTSFDSGHFLEYESYLFKNESIFLE